MHVCVYIYVCMYIHIYIYIYKYIHVYTKWRMRSAPWITAEHIHSRTHTHRNLVTPMCMLTDIYADRYILVLSPMCMLTDTPWIQLAHSQIYMCVCV